MSREILFRVKRAGSKEWVYGFLVKIPYDEEIFSLILSPSETKIEASECPISFDENEAFAVYSETVGQFTGLLDKNGKKIFDGDIIVKGCYPYFDNGVKNYVSTVEWIYSSWQEVLHCINPLKNGISDGVNDIIEEDDDDDGSTSFEIIGNIHDNQELLRKEARNE